MMRPLSWLDRLDAIAPAFVDAAVRGAIVLLVALVVSLLLRRRSAAARHLVWVGAILVQLVLPVFARWGPRWDVAVPIAVTSVLPVPLADTRDQRPDDALQLDTARISLTGGRRAGSRTTGMSAASRRAAITATCSPRGRRTCFW